MDGSPEDLNEEYLPMDLVRQALDQKTTNRLKSAKIELLSGTDNLYIEKERLEFWRIIYTVEALIWRIRERMLQ